MDTQPRSFSRDAALTSGARQRHLCRKTQAQTVRIHAVVFLDNLDQARHR
jgi:hypothetical protein